MAGLHDVLASPMAATWCGWSFARVTSAWLGHAAVQSCRLASQPLHPMLQNTPRSVIVSGAPWFPLSQCWSHHLPQSPPFRGHPHVLWSRVKLSVTSSGRAGGSEAFLPGPANPEMDTRACEPRREKRITRAIGNSSARGTPCAARGCTRVVAGLAVGPGFVSSWLRPPSGATARARRLTKVITTGH